MTIEKKLLELLVSHGLMPDQAEKVMVTVKAAKENDCMKDRWAERVEDYPEQILALGWMSAKMYALEFIDREFPKHWARPMFLLNQTPTPVTVGGD